MKRETLFAKFNQALAWNSVLFFVHKISKTSITFILYKKLTVTDFSTWANAFSLVFITALWFDFGLRKSLPRYCPEFAKNNAFKKSFINKILLIYTGLLLLANTAFILFTPQFASFVNLSNRLPFFYLGCALFFIESIKSLLRILFYSHFWQRQYNLLETSTVTVATVCLVFFSATMTESIGILWLLFSIEIIASVVTVAAALIMLTYLHEDPDYKQEKKIDTTKVVKDFAVHSGVMWFLTSVKSLSERNVLIPFFTYVFGPTASSLFKVANDAALLFQRFVIRVIGTPGMSLLSHVESNFVASEKGSSKNTFINDTVDHLNKRVIILTIPLFGPLIFIFLKRMWPHEPLIGISLPTMSHNVFLLFALLTSSYLAQLIFMAFERILEVKRDYKELLLTFLPYIGILALLGVGIYQPDLVNHHRLIFIVAFIHCIRILGVLLRIYIATKKYALYLPIGLTVKVTVATILISTICSAIF